MRTQYYQVTGRGPWTIDYPGGVATAHRPGQIIGPVAPTNRGIVRGLRSKRLRKLSEREATALRNYAAVNAGRDISQPVPLKPLPKRKRTATPAEDMPIVIVDDQPKLTR